MLGTALVVLLGAQGLLGYELNILHINDAHAHIDGTSRSSGLCREGSTCYGGFARVVAKVKEIRAKAPNVVFLNAGDMFQGTPYFSRFKSDVLIDFVNQMGFDAQSLGNHEFDEGVPELAKYLKKVQTPMLCCNIDLNEEPSMKSKVLMDSIMLSVGGVQVGIMGYLTQDILADKRGKVKVLPEIPSLKRAAAELKNKGAQIIIGLGHSGYEPELEIAKEVEDLDVVVGGHSHTFLYTGKPKDDFDKPKGPYPTMVLQANGKKVPVVQAFQFTKYLGWLKLEFDSEFRLVNATGNPILLEPKFPRDQKILALQEEWDKNMTETCKLVGEFVADVDGDRTVCRFQECAMGKFIADALRDHALQMSNGSEALAFLHGGMIRSTIEKGRLTAGELHSVLPFAPPPVLVSVPGSTLRQALEFSVRDYSEIVGTPRYIQVSGMEVKLDLKKMPGSRVVSAKVIGKSGELSTLDDSSTYRIIMSKFTWDGGDGFSFKQGSTFIQQAENPVSKILLEYLRKHGPYDPKEAGTRVELVKN